MEHQKILAYGTEGTPAAASRLDVSSRPQSAKKVEDSKKFILGLGCIAALLVIPMVFIAYSAEGGGGPVEELSLSLDLYPYDEVAHALLDEPLGTLERTVQRKTDLENPVKLGSIYHLSSLRTMVKLASTGPVKRSDQNMAPVYKSGVATARRQAKHPRTGIVRNKARHKIHVGHAKSGARTHVDSDRRSAVGDKRARSGVVDLQADSLTSDRLREVDLHVHTRRAEKQHAAVSGGEATGRRAPQDERKPPRPSAGAQGHHGDGDADVARTPEDGAARDDDTSTQVQAHKPKAAKRTKPATKHWVMAPRKSKQEAAGNGKAAAARASSDQPHLLNTRGPPRVPRLNGAPRAQLMRLESMQSEQGASRALGHYFDTTHSNTKGFVPFARDRVWTLANEKADMNAYFDNLQRHTKRLIQQRRSLREAVEPPVAPQDGDADA